MSLPIFTLLHVLISLAGLVTGFIVVGGWLGGRSQPRWAQWFLGTTVATSVTGFFFPFRGFSPPHAFGALSLLILAVTLYALYGRRLVGGWRKTYVITATIALYLNFFVLVAQLFQRSPALHQLAPTQREPAFGVTQLVVLVLFVWLGRAAARSFPGAAELEANVKR